MKKRDIFAELMEGMDALAAEKAGKITLKTVEIELPEPAPVIVRAKEIVQVRKSLQMSQNVFARVLRIAPATLRNWEQGRVEPNAQAATLIKLVQKDPTVIQQLCTL